jgi:hypothetical protein
LTELFYWFLIDSFPAEARPQIIEQLAFDEEEILESVPEEFRDIAEKRGAKAAAEWLNQDGLGSLQSMDAQMFGGSRGGLGGGLSA